MSWMDPIKQVCSWSGLWEVLTASITPWEANQCITVQWTISECSNSRTIWGRFSRMWRRRRKCSTWFLRTTPATKVSRISNRQTRGERALGVPLKCFKRISKKALTILTYFKTTAIINCRAILEFLGNESRASRTATQIKNCHPGRQMVAVGTTHYLSTLVRARATRLPCQNLSICQAQHRQSTNVAA